MKEPAIGLQMYTLRQFCATPDDAARTLERVAKIGYRTVQISGICAMKAADLRKILDANGLSACSTHTGYEAIVKETDRIVEEHRTLGCEAVVCPGLPGELHNDRGYRTVAAAFSAVLPKLRSAGLILGYHNHGAELARYDGKTGLEILLDGCPGMEAEIDTHWIQFAGGDPAAWIARCAGRASEVHFKDMGIENGKQTMPPIGAGNLNWPAIVAACRTAGTRFALVEMDTWTIEPFEAVRISFENMRSWGLSAD